MSSTVFALAALSALSALLLVWEKSVSGSAVIYAVQATCVGGIAIAHARDAGTIVLVIAVVALRGPSGRASACAAPRSRATRQQHRRRCECAHSRCAAGRLRPDSGRVPRPRSRLAAAGLGLGETLVGLWLVASRRALLSQVIGLMAAENGAALLMRRFSLANKEHSSRACSCSKRWRSRSHCLCLLPLSGALVERDSSLLQSLSGNKAETR